MRRVRDRLVAADRFCKLSVYIQESVKKMWRARR